MYQLRRTGPIGYEDLMRELGVIEHRLLKEDRATAMSLMVLEAKLRERFQYMEQLLEDGHGKTETSRDSLTLEDLQALIPQDFPAMPLVREKHRLHKRLMKTLGTAAVFAVLTAAGVFGLASAIQIVLNWLI
jgi:hypothetical protein